MGRVPVVVLLGEWQGSVSFQKRNDLTKRFPTLQGIASLIEADNAVLDGKIVAVDKDGLPCFDQLRARRTDCEIIYYAFDLLYLNDQDLRNEPLLTRKTKLGSVLPMSDCARVRPNL